MGADRYTKKKYAKKKRMDGPLRSYLELLCSFSVKKIMCNIHNNRIKDDYYERPSTGCRTAFLAATLQTYSISLLFKFKINDKCRRKYLTEAVAVKQKPRLFALYCPLSKGGETSPRYYLFHIVLQYLKQRTIFFEMNKNAICTVQYV